MGKLWDNWENVISNIEHENDPVLCNRMSEGEALV